MRKLFSQSYDLGIQTVFHQDEHDPSRFHLEKRFDVEPLLRQNHAERVTTSGERWGDVRKIFSIPLPLYFDLKAKGVIDDQKKLWAWLKDNPQFFTFEAAAKGNCLSE